MIPITQPLFGAEEEQAAVASIRSGWVTQGPQVAAFEGAVAEYCGAAHAVAVSNCTTALHLALLLHGIGPGDEVICPSMSFIATANSIRYTGATPIFAEVDLRTYNLDVEAARAAITPAHQGHFAGPSNRSAGRLGWFLSLAARHGLKIIEDAACAIGSKYRGRPIGSHAETVCFSFHPRKVITTGEGGVITTSRADFADKLRLLRQHGMNVSDARGMRHAKSSSRATSVWATTTG